MAPTTATSTPGTRGHEAPEPEDHRQRRDADRPGRCRSCRPSRSPPGSPKLVDTSVSRVDAEAEQLGELADEHDDGDTVEEADPHRLGQQLGEDTEAAQAGGDAHEAHEKGQHAGERDRLGSDRRRTDERQDRRRDQRPERRVGAEHEDRRRAEDRIGEQRHHRGVEARHRREPGQFGVGHALRHEQGGEDEPGDDVLPRPTPFVGPRHDDARDLVENLAHTRTARWTMGRVSTSAPSSAMGVGPGPSPSPSPSARCSDPGTHPRAASNRTRRSARADDASGRVDRVGVHRDRGDAEAHEVLGELGPVRRRLAAQRRGDAARRGGAR